jgi:hypothetical protein
MLWRSNKGGKSYTLYRAAHNKEHLLGTKEMKDPTKQDEG